MSVHICEDSVAFVRDGELAGVMPIEAIHQEGLELFKKQNYELQGSVGYSTYLKGVLSGLTLAYGPSRLQRLSVAASGDGESDREPQSIDASEVGTVEDVLLEPRPLPGEEIIMPGYTVYDGVVDASEVGTVEDVLLKPGILDGLIVGTSEPTAAPAAEVAAATEAPAQP